MSSVIHTDKIVARYYEQTFGKGKKYLDLSDDERMFLETLFMLGFQTACQAEGIEANFKVLDKDGVLYDVK